jgi:hypothetical protein
MAGTVPDLIEKKFDRNGKGRTDGRAAEQRKGGNKESIPAPIWNSMKSEHRRIRDQFQHRSRGRLDGDLRIWRENGPGRNGGFDAVIDGDTDTKTKTS